MNKVVIIGRLVKDPELKFLPGSGVANTSFTVAVDKFTKKDEPKQADFIGCVAWNKTAELIANYMKKGSLIGISGRISTRNYEAKDGTKRYVTEVVADEVQFLDSKDKTSTEHKNDPKNNTPDDMPEVGGDIPF